ncbi:ATP-binding cassette domain-containing protein [Rhodobacter capsulatus]|uniref:ATP-binding cassette domain-containing protein n=1 Tax=Rhodobacter capsulatus TaxID=1061 RepID=UPI004025AB20
MTLLQAKDITVTAGAERLLDPVSLDLPAGRAVTVLGESGSGKSLLAQALLGTLPGGLLAGGTLTVGGTRLDPARPQGSRALWGARSRFCRKSPGWRSTR